METTRHIGTDLDRSKFTYCMQMANGRNYLSECRQCGKHSNPSYGSHLVGCTRH
jgi:hypothetical protein